LPEFDLRPLSLGEILDRTFTLYRKHFSLFFGIAAIPQILVLAVSLIFLYIEPPRVPSANPFEFLTSPLVAIGTVVTIIASLAAYILAQGGSILGVSEIYLGRQITIAEALGKVRGHIGFLFGVIVLNSLAIMASALLLIIPGIYVACRLITCLPCAVIEEKGPRESLSRSFSLTKGFAGRSFMIYVVYFVIAFVLGLLLDAPFSFLLLSSTGNPAMFRIWSSMTQVTGAVSTALVMPIILIATSIFYYDLRVRKEAFDIQFMMNPELNPPSPPATPSIL
jgi:hypothetical protein